MIVKMEKPNLPDGRMNGDHNHNRSDGEEGAENEADPMDLDDTDSTANNSSAQSTASHAGLLSLSLHQRFVRSLEQPRGVSWSRMADEMDMTEAQVQSYAVRYLEALVRLGNQNAISPATTDAVPTDAITSPSHPNGGMITNGSTRSNPRHRRTPHGWTEEELTLLETLLARYASADFSRSESDETTTTTPWIEQVAAYFPTRTTREIQRAYERYYHPGRRRHDTERRGGSR